MLIAHLRGMQQGICIHVFISSFGGSRSGVQFAVWGIAGDDGSTDVRVVTLLFVNYDFGYDEADEENLQCGSCDLFMINISLGNDALVIFRYCDLALV